MAFESLALWVAAAVCAGIATDVRAAEAAAVPSVYMGGPVELVKAPNGAISNQKLLDRVGDFNWLKPTIENPAPGIWVFGGFGLAPMSIIEAEDGLIAFDTGANFRPINTFINPGKIEGKDTIQVTKDPKIKAVDEATFARLIESDFRNGTIEVKVLSRLLENAPDFARGFIGIAFRINESNSKFECIYIRPTNGRAEDQSR